MLKCEYTNRNMKALRAKAGMTKESLAAAAGLSFNTIVAIEREEEDGSVVAPTATTLAAIIGALDADPKDFFVVRR